jgi:hypothetical protein
MDNRLNGLRRKIKALRLEMLDLQVSVRDQISRDRDCTESSVRLMGMRRELTVLVKEWTRLGGGDRCRQSRNGCGNVTGPWGGQSPSQPPKPRSAVWRRAAEGES